MQFSWTSYVYRPVLKVIAWQVITVTLQCQGLFIKSISVHSKNRLLILNADRPYSELIIRTEYDPCSDEKISYHFTYIFYNVRLVEHVSCF